MPWGCDRPGAIMKFEDLDAQQKKVIVGLQTKSRILVTGGPGTGKTTSALWAARQHIEATGEHVLFLTFSRSAVAQIANRQAAILTDLEESVEIMTFHALAYRLIRAFGRYDGHGLQTPLVQSEAYVKLFGRDDSRFKYDDLLPTAIGLLENGASLRSLVSSRWKLVICDEAQDLNEEQLSLLKIIADQKLILLGDPGQMIYGFIGASQKVFADVKALAEEEIPLEPRSHRDPSGVIPAVAEAVRRRDFTHEALQVAVAEGRLELLSNDEEPSRST